MAVCLYCGDEIVAQRSSAKFCQVKGKNCRQNFHVQKRKIEKMGICAVGDIRQMKALVNQHPMLNSDRTAQLGRIFAVIAFELGVKVSDYATITKFFSQDVQLEMFYQEHV